jgi:transcriptional regulator GlxA family with amidase domain
MVGRVADDQAVLKWIKTQSIHTLYTMSVCNGAFILANTGLLDGLTATTTRSNIQRLREEHPQIKVVKDQRLVDNGRIITTGGTLGLAALITSAQ